MNQNKVQLITYADSLGGNLEDIKLFLDTYLANAIEGVHILPFYPSSADRGFAPLTHLEVDEKFGDWSDINAIARAYSVTADLTVNHLSAQSEYFQNYLKHGNNSPYCDMFLDEASFFARYNVGPESISNIYRPRPTSPFTTYKFADGTEKEIWTTFTSEQIDLDVESETSRDIIRESIAWLSKQGVNTIRLDAVGYVIKRPNTSCFLIPETFEYLNWIRNITPPEVQLLAEFHGNPERQFELLDKTTIDFVYDFSLPFLTLNALRTGKTKHLLPWIERSLPNMITTLDTHDGIGVVDVAGLLPEDEIDNTIAWMEERGASQSLRASGADFENLDIYQINCTYYSALGEDDDAYIAARAIQLFLPGLPQIYYVGLLAGENDYETLMRTHHGRDINRHNYTWPEIERAIEKSVVKRLIMLMELRNTHQSFAGEFSFSATKHELTLLWTNKFDHAKAIINLETKITLIEFTNQENHQIERLTA